MTTVSIPITLDGQGVAVTNIVGYGQTISNLKGSVSTFFPVLSGIYLDDGTGYPSVGGGGSFAGRIVDYQLSRNPWNTGGTITIPPGSTLHVETFATGSAAGATGTISYDVMSGEGSLETFIEYHDISDDLYAFARFVLRVGNSILNVRFVGAEGNGITDDTAAINAALFLVSQAGGGFLLFPPGDYLFTGQLDIPANCVMLGEGYASRLHPVNVTGNTIVVAGDHVKFQNLRFEGDTPGVVKIDGHSDVAFQNCYFKSQTAGTLGQCVWVWNTSNILVENCTFERTSYGVIQQLATSSNGVKVVDCVAFDMLSDFVEINGGPTASCRDWSVMNCTYDGSHIFPAEGTETRFVGATSVEDLRIEGCSVRHCSGDSAIHLEDVLGKTIVSGNTFMDCKGTFAYLGLFNSAEDVLITDNYFLHRDITLGLETVMDLSSVVATNRIVFSGNHVEGGTTYLLNAINASSHNGPLVVEGNLFRRCGTVLDGSAGANNVMFQDNYVDDCNYGVTCIPPGLTGGSFNNSQVIGNRFNCNTNSIELRRNGNGTGSPTRWVIDNNFIGGTGGGAVGFDTTDVKARNNTLAPGRTLNLGQTFFVGSVRYTEYGTKVEGTASGYKINEDLVLTTPGTGLQLKTGANNRAGTAVLVAGTVTVANITVTANTLILLTHQVAGGVLGVLSVGVVTPGTSFVVNSSSAADTSTVTWLLIEPS